VGKKPKIFFSEMIMDPEIQEQYEEQLRQSTELLSQYNSVMASTLANFAKTVQPLDHATRDATRATRDSARATQAAGQALRTYAEAEVESTKKTTAASEGLKNALHHGTKALGSFSTALFSGTEGFAKYGAGLNSLGDAAAAATSQFGPLGKAVGLAAQGLTRVAELAFKQADSLNSFADTFKKMGAVGGMTNAELLEMAQSAGYASMDLQKLLKPIATLGSAVVNLGGTAAEGQKSFMNIANIGSDARKKFNRLGMQIEDVNNAQAQYIALQRMSGMAFSSSAKDQERLKKSSVEYAENLIKLAAITGEDIDSIKKQQEIAYQEYQELMATAAMRTRIEELKKRGNDVEAQAEIARIENRLSATQKLKDDTNALFGTDMGAQIRDYIRSGGRISEENIGAARAGGQELETLRQLAAQGATPEQIGEQMQKLRDEMRKSIGATAQQFGADPRQPGALAILDAKSAEELGRQFGATPELVQKLFATSQKPSEAAAAAAAGVTAAGKEGFDKSADARANLTELEIKAKVELDKLLLSVNPLTSGFTATTIAATALFGAASVAAVALSALAGKAVLAAGVDAMGGGGGRGRGRGRLAAGGAGRLLGSGAGRLLAGSAVVGAGLDIYGRAQEKQSATQIAAGVGGGLAGAALGAKGGAMAGGAIGSLFGGVGAVPGAAIGGLLGGGLGYFAGGKAGDALFGAFKGKGKPESEVATPDDTAISPETQAILNEGAKSSKALAQLIKTSDSTTASTDSTTEMSESIKKFKDELLSTGNMLNRFKQALDALSQLMFNMSGNTETTPQGGSPAASSGGSTSGAPQIPANLGSYMAATAMIESGGRADARATTSSAGGMFQFLDSTWKQLTKEMGKDYSLQDKFDPNKAAEVMAYFTEKQRKQLEKGTGRRASNTDLYMAHFLGAGGATQFLNAMNRDPNAIAADLNPNAAKANRNIYYDGDRARTLGEVYELMNKKMSTATAKVQKGDTPEFVQQLARSGGPQLAGGPPADTKLISSKPDNITLGDRTDLSGMNSNLLSRFFTAAKEFRRPIKVNSAHRSDQYQAELWVRGNILGESGIHTPARPMNDTTITYRGKQYKVDGSGIGSKHSRGEALDISADRGAFDPYLHKYGLHRPYRNDPPHVELKAEKGGVFTGPSSGYPATLHGTELIAPLVNNSALMMLAKSPATQLDSLMDMKDDKAFGSLSSASFTPKTMTATINKIVRDMNSEKTATVENTIKNDTFARNANLDNTRLNVAVMELLNAKLDSMVDAIRTTNDISEKILRASNN
jgi:hypothetical protein